MFYINGEYWKIVAVPSNSIELLRSDGNFAVGVCDDNNKAIYLNNELEGAFLKKVLCHEITHAAMFSYNVYLSIFQEEIVADLIATYGEQIIDITDDVFMSIKNKLGRES